MAMIPASRGVDFASLQRKSFNEGDAAGYCEAWYSNFPDLEVLDGSVAAVVHDNKPCLSGLWLCNELSEGNDIDLLLANAQGHLFKLRGGVVVAAPVMVVSMLLELIECERSWIAKALFCTGMSVYIPVYENGHYCAAYIDCGTKCVYWIDSLDIRQRAAGDVATACSVLGLDFVDLKVSWQRDSWSCGVWCV